MLYSIFMSTAPSSVQASLPETLHTFRVSAGSRTFFFDVKSSVSGVFLSVTEARLKDEEWTRSRILIPAEHAKAFYGGLCEAIRAMRSEEQPHSESKSESKSPSQPGPAKRKPVGSRSKR